MRKKRGFTLAESLVALWFVSIALFGYIALQIRLIDSNEKLVAKQEAIETAEVQLAQNATATRRTKDQAVYKLVPNTAKSSWADRNGTHDYLVDSLNAPVRYWW